MRPLDCSTQTSEACAAETAIIGLILVPEIWAGLRIFQFSPCAIGIVLCTFCDGCLVRRKPASRQKIG
jgi:hypothetical protein